MPPTLQEFEAEVESFLDPWPIRGERSRFRWGVGSDDVSVFEESGAADARAELDEVRAWRGQLAEAGLAWITGPEEYGGRGLQRTFQARFDALARRRAVPGSGPLTVSLGMVAPTILAHGTEAAKREYLAAMHAGAVVACQLFSEPSAGSDLASVATRAERDGDRWRISGQKVWTSGAHLADIGEVLCRTSENGRHANLTAFIVDMHQPGVIVRPLRQMTGGASFNEVCLDGAEVTDDRRLGEVDGGWRVALTTLANERGAIGSGGFGGKGLLSLDRLSALLRHTETVADPVIRQHVGHLVCGLRTAAWTRARWTSSGQIASHAPLLKLALCRDLSALAGVVGAALGPELVADSGDWGTYAWSRFVLGVPGYRIGGGTDEVLRSVIAERVLGLPKGP